MMNSPISSFALAKRSFENGIRSVRRRNISWAPFRQAICSASSPFLLFAKGSAPEFSNNFVVSSLYFTQDKEISNKYRPDYALYELLYSLGSPMFLYCIVKCSFILNIFGWNERTNNLERAFSLKCNYQMVNSPLTSAALLIKYEHNWTDCTLFIKHVPPL